MYLGYHIFNIRNLLLEFSKNQRKHIYILLNIFSFRYIYAFTRFERENVITSLQQMRMDGSHMKILVEDMKTDIYISASLNTLKQTLYFISGMYGRGREIHQVKTSGRHLKILIPENYGFDYKALTTIGMLLVNVYNLVAPHWTSCSKLC